MAGTPVERIPVYCYQCVAGPDLLKVIVKDGVAVGVEPNADMAEIHPACGKVCVRAYGLIQKLYNPARVPTPMRRTNPRKGRDQDPGWEPISWDAALAVLADRLNALRAKGLTDDAGYPRLPVTFGSGGIAPAYLGTFAAFLAAWGPVDQGIGSGQGVKCYHSEHLYGEFWHRAFTVAADAPHSELVLSFGYNGDASGGVTGVWRHVETISANLLSDAAIGKIVLTTRDVREQKAVLRVHEIDRCNVGHSCRHLQLGVFPTRATVGGARDGQLSTVRVPLGDSRSPAALIVHEVGSRDFTSRNRRRRNRMRLWFQS